ncbi:hypothetical protein [Spiroplasma endosymbiont of Danaus chrysippus]|uniref:hypothetical protein n=1 Tax=Spiroplasma endosymbiont of Danaus chrysippus TaxID=2691041 RepID=UPI0013CD598E|nr:hypothetical protein [Spiroplasma endosymbiont of Danaus chrysippus]CAB1053714.1 hypothetical protein [Spiroplasma endosymbiont of Danaus chrysippus]
MVKNLNDSFEKLIEQNNDSLEKILKKRKAFKNNEKKIINKISNINYQKINDDEVISFKSKKINV